MQRYPELLAAIEAIAGERQGINTRRLGKWLGQHADRRLDGRWLVNAGTSHSAVKWQVQSEKPVA